MEYKIAERSDSSDLEMDVQELISQGWRPLGGVSVVRWEVTDLDGYTERYWLYAQALTRDSA